MEIDYLSIGARIRAARQNKNLAQYELGQLTGLTASHISNIERGTTKLGLPALINVANVLEVSVDELLCDTITHAEIAYHKELNELVKDCTADELYIITEIVKVIRRSGINKVKTPRRRRTKAQIEADQQKELAAYIEQYGTNPKGPTVFGKK